MKAKFYFLLILGACISRLSHAQNVAINASGSSADASAMLDITSTSKGLLMPRMTTTEQNAISLPANGLTIFNTTLNTIMINKGTAASPNWSPLVSGTVDTSSITNFWSKTRSLFSATAPVTYGNGVIGITQSGSSTNGYLSSTDWNTFNNKQAALSGTGFVKISGTTITYDNSTYLTSVDTSNISNFHVKVKSVFTGTAPITYANGTIGITQSGTSSNGYLSSTDWNTFNNKANASTTWSTLGNSVASAQKIGTLTAYDFPVYTNNVERMRVTSAGLVGIGTTSPANTLQVVATSDPLALGGLQSGTNTDSLLTVSNGVVKRLSPASLVTSSSNAWGLTGNAGTNATTHFVGTTDNKSLRFRTKNIQRMIVDSVGNVGIGTTGFDTYVPEKLLVDAGTTSYNGTYNAMTPINGIGFTNGYLQIQVQNRCYGNYSSSDLVAASDGTRAGTVPYNTDTHYVDFGINSSGYTNSNSNILNQPYTAYLYSTTPQDFYIGNGYYNRDIIFFTNYGPTNSSNTADGFEIMRLKGGTTQQVTIGTPTPNGTNRLTISGATYSSGNITSGGTMYASAFTVSSDARLKKNIQPLSYGLNEVLRLDPKSYNWKESTDSAVQLGLIAQEVQKVMPELVSQNESSNTLSLNYTELVPVLINAVKELQAQIDELKKAK